MTTPKTTFTYPLSPAQQASLLELLRTGNYRPVPVQHTRIAVQAEACNINLYNSGKCVIQGKGAEEFVTFFLEPMVLQSAGLGYEDVLNPEATTPHMGVDESGKGDFFGPLVIAAAYVDRSLAIAMRKLNVRDSKQIGSDKAARDIARELRNLLAGRFAIVKIGPRAYNRLYAKMHSVNTMLAWGHARAIENLLERVPDCPRAVSDQFGKKEQVERALMQKARKIELVQRHRAESDLAVAAASILARDGFLDALAAMRQQYGVSIPKGASATVRTAAAELARARGAETLLDTVKCHFRTTDEVLKTLNLTRATLGPEGQAVSKPYEWRKPSSPPAGE